MNLTYNEIIERDGEKVGLAYEKLVAAHLEKSGVEEAKRNLMAQDHSAAKAEYLCRRAERHAEQELGIATAYSNDGPDMNDILPVPVPPIAAVCPRCESKLMWDWDQDCYMVSRNNGPAVYCPITPVADKLHSHTCPYCMKVFAFSLIDDDGETTFNHPTHTNIDWQAEGNWFSMNTLELPVK